MAFSKLMTFGLVSCPFSLARAVCVTTELELLSGAWWVNTCYTADSGDSSFPSAVSLAVKVDPPSSQAGDFLCIHLQAGLVTAMAVSYQSLVSTALL